MIFIRLALVLVAATAVLVVRFAGHSGSSPSGHYAGTTSQGLPVAFVVDHGAVRDFTFAWRAKCADGEVHTNTIDIGGASLTNGRFAAGGTLNTGGQTSALGTVHGKVASGQLSRSGPSAFGTTCSATGISWQAHQ